jgi:putative transposase
MARPHRFAPPGVPLHVVTRAIQDQQLFYDPIEFRAFEGLLAEGLVRADVALFDYVLMPNHVHLVCTARRPGAVSQLLKFVKQTHAGRWRRRRSSTGRGHVFQGRFSSHPIQTERYLYNVFAYVSRNPMRARFVRSAVEWRWSGISRREYGDRIATRLLSSWPEPMPSNWARIVDEGFLAEDDDTIRECIRTGAPYGDPQWSARLQREAS